MLFTFFYSSEVNGTACGEAAPADNFMKVLQKCNLILLFMMFLHNCNLILLMIRNLFKLGRFAFILIQHPLHKNSNNKMTTFMIKDCVFNKRKGCTISKSKLLHHSMFQLKGIKIRIKLNNCVKIKITITITLSYYRG